MAGSEVTQRQWDILHVAVSINTVCFQWAVRSAHYYGKLEYLLSSCRVCSSLQCWPLTSPRSVWKVEGVSKQNHPSSRQFSLQQQVNTLHSLNHQIKVNRSPNPQNECFSSLFPHQPACCYIRTNEGMDTMGTDCQRWSGLLTVELRLTSDRSSSYSMLEHLWFPRSNYLCIDTHRVWPSP